MRSLRLDHWAAMLAYVLRTFIASDMYEDEKVPDAGGALDAAGGTDLPAGTIVTPKTDADGIRTWALDPKSNERRALRSCG